MANPIGNNQASDVYVSELNLSTIITTVATSVGAMVGATTQGKLGRQLVSDYASFKTQYGPSNPSQSRVHMAVRDYFTKGGEGIIFNRVCGAGYKYAGVLLQYTGSTGNQTLKLTPYGIGGENPADTIDFRSAGGVSDSNQNLCYIYGIGPGTRYNQYAISITSNNIMPPGNLSLTPALTGGILQGGTQYTYGVSAMSALGETLTSTQLNITLEQTTSGSVVISWDPVPGAIGYRIYGRSTGSTGTGTVSLGLIGSVGQGIVQFVDTGRTVPTTVPPTPVNSNSNRFTFTDVFAINVYDLASSVNAPVETHAVTLAPSVNGMQQQQEIETVINTQSQYIRVVSNYPNMTVAPPTIFTLQAVTMNGGANGAAVTSADLINGWQAFADKDTVQVAQLIDGGYAIPSVQKAMLSIAKDRQDCVVFGDVPSDQQNAIDAVAYRTLTLNENSDRIMLFTSDIQEIDPDTNSLVWVPGSGAAAGSAAAVDSQIGSGGSIAGPTYGAITTAVKLRHNYTKAQRNMLAGSQVNYWRSRTGIGTYLAEQKTCSTPISAVTYYSVRRIFDVMEQSIELALTYSLQAPNTQFTAQQIASMLTQYLNGLVSAQRINGFSVRVDNSPAVRAQGNLQVYAAIEPILPIDKIGLLTIITPQGANFEEILGNVAPGATVSAT